MKLLGLLLATLISVPSLGALTDTDRAEDPFKNLLADKNPGFENGTAKWTASGGTFTTVTSSTNFMGIGKRTGTWDSSAAAQTLTSQAVTVPKGLAGTNGLWRCKVMNLSAATQTMGTWDGSTLANTITIDPGTTPKYVEISTSFGAAASTTAIRFTSVASNEPLISIDDCYIGPNFNLASGVVMTDWTPFTMSVGAVTTPPTLATTNSTTSYWRRVGDSMQIRYTYFAASAAGAAAGSGLYLYSLPSGYSIDTGKVVTGTQAVGVGQHPLGHGQVAQTTTAAGGGAGVEVFAYDSTRLFLIDSGQVAGQVNQVSSTNFNYSTANASFEFFAEVPIAGWTATSAGVRADQSNFGWTAYTPTYVGLGTVTSNVRYRRNGQNLEIGGNFITGTTTGSTASMTLPTGLAVDSGFTSISGSVLNQVGNITSDTSSGALKSVITSAGATTLNFSLVASSGVQALHAGIGSAVFGSAENESIWVSVPIQGWVVNQNAPMLVGTVFSNTGGQERIERARITGSATTPTIASQSGSWLSGVSRTSGGKYVVTIVTGMFSAAPTCTCRCKDSGNAEACEFAADSTTTSVETVCVKTSNEIGNDQDREIICMGPR